MNAPTVVRLGAPPGTAQPGRATACMLCMQVLLRTTVVGRCERRMHEGATNADADVTTRIHGAQQ
jgi:hypothetical protein